MEVEFEMPMTALFAGAHFRLGSNAINCLPPPESLDQAKDGSLTLRPFSSIMSENYRLYQTVEG